MPLDDETFLNSFNLHIHHFYWAAQILHMVFDIPILISTLHLDDDDADDNVAILKRYSYVSAHASNYCCHYE